MLFAELEALAEGAKRWQGKLAQLPLKEGKSHALKLLLDHVDLQLESHTGGMILFLASTLLILTVYLRCCWHTSKSFGRSLTQLLPCRLHSSQQTYTMLWTFFCQRNSREAEGEILDQEGTHRDGQGCACCRALCAPLCAPLHRGWSHQLTKSRLGGLSCWGPLLLMGYCKLMHIR